MVKLTFLFRYEGVYGAYQAEAEGQTPEAFAVAGARIFERSLADAPEGHALSVMSQVVMLGVIGEMNGVTIQAKDVPSLMEAFEALFPSPEELPPEEVVV